MGVPYATERADILGVMLIEKSPSLLASQSKVGIATILSVSYYLAYTLLVWECVMNRGVDTLVRIRNEGTHGDFGAMRSLESDLDTFFGKNIKKRFVDAVALQKRLSLQYEFHVIFSPSIINSPGYLYLPIVPLARWRASRS